MNISNKLLFIALAAFTVCLVQGQGNESADFLVNDNNDTNTTTAAPTSSTTESTTPSTTPSTISTSTGSSSSSTSPSTTGSSTSPTSTTSTSSSTTAPKTTTTAPPAALPIVNFTWPKNESEPACLLVRLSLEMNISYPTEDKSNATAKFVLQPTEDYTADCSTKFNQLNVKTAEGWTLTFNYTIDSTDDAKYKLSQLILNYEVTKALFPNVAADYIGAKTAELANLTEFATSTGSSYKCNAQTTILLDSRVSLAFSNYQGEPFIPKDKKDRNFDTAVDCPADATATSKLVPIIVGSTLAVLVVLVLVAYIIGRRKHRPGYQQV